MISLRELIDPDTNWWGADKVKHFLSFLILASIACTFLPGLSVFLLMLWTGIVYEAGQTDIAYNIKDAGGRRYAGRPGYGFGWMDLIFDMAGTFVGVGLMHLAGFA